MGQHHNKRRVSSRHISAGHTLIAVVNREDNAAVEGEAVEEFGGGSKGRRVGVERPAPIVSFPLRQAPHELRFHVIIVLQTFNLQALHWHSASERAARYLDAVGNHEVPHSRMVYALDPLNAVIDVIDFDRHTEGLMNVELAIA